MRPVIRFRILNSSLDRCTPKMRVTKAENKSVAEFRSWNTNRNTQVQLFIISTVTSHLITNNGITA